MKHRGGIRRMLGRKSILALVISAAISVGMLYMLSPVSATSTATCSDVSPDYIKANSDYVAMIKLVTGPASTNELRIIDLSFSGSGFDTSDLLPLNATQDSGVSVWKDSNQNGIFDGAPDDGKIVLSVDPVWDGNNVTLQLTSGHNIGETFFVVIKTSGTVSDGDIINVTITRAQEWNGSAYSNITLTGVLSAEVTADTIAPTVAVTSPNGGEYWSGTQTITWTTTDANIGTVTIEYSNNSGTNWTTIASGISDTGSYSWNTTNVSDGSNYLIRVTATDLAGNTGSDTSNATFTVDNTDPTVTITLPQDGSYYKSGDPIDTNITGTASDATSGISYVNITIYNQTGNKYWTGSAWQDGVAWLNTNGTTSWYNDSGLPTWADGNTYIVNATAVDNAGNKGTASSTFTYDASPPISSVDAVTPYWQTSSPLTVTATASDTTSGVASVSLYYRNSTDNSSWSSWMLFGTDSNGADGWSWSFNFLNGTGYYEFYTIATDNAGNIESAPGSADAICGYDYTPPSSQLDTITPYWRTTSSISITSSTFSDDLSGIAYVDLYYRWSPDNSTTWSNWIFSSRETIPDGGHYIWSFSFPNGTAHYQFYTIATDNAGNTESAPGSADAICGYDNVGPNVTITAPIHGGFYGPNQNLTNITGQATDLAGVLTVNITIRNTSTNKYWNGTAWVSGPVNLTATLLNPNGTTTGWYYNTLPVWKDNTAYNINATATDILGNVNNTPIFGENWRVFTYDASPPTCTIEYSDSRDYYKAGDIVRIYVNFTEIVSGINESSVKISIDTQGNGDLPNTSMTKTDNTHWYYDWTIPNGTDENGAFTVKIYAKDNANNSLSPYPTTDSSKGIDNTPPTVSIATISPYWQTTSPITITVSASDSLSGLMTVDLLYSYRSDNSTNWSSWYANSSLNNTAPWIDPNHINFSFNFPMGEGHYRFVARAYDNASNSNISSILECGYDSTPPTTTIVLPVDGAYYNSLDNITGYATDDTSGIKNVYVRIERSIPPEYWNGTGWQGTIVWLTANMNTSAGAKNVTWWYTSLPSWTDGESYTVYAYAVDIASLSGSQTSSHFYIDSSKPSVSNVVITDVTIGSTDWVKNGDVVNITATVTDFSLVAGDTSYIRANLSAFGLDNNVQADGYNGATAWWNFTVVACSPSDGTIVIPINVTDKAGNYNNTEYGTITADNTPPVLNYSVLDADHDGSHYTYIDVYFYDANGLDTSTIDASDFDVINALNSSIDVVQVVGTSGTSGVITVTLKMNGYLSTSNSPKIAVVGEITDPAGNVVAIGSNVTINTFRINLHTGWNLISIPARNVNITELMETIKDNLESVWSYDATDPNPNTAWKSFKFYGNTPIGALKDENDENMEPGRGYWINVTAPCVLVGNYPTLVEADTTGEYPPSPPEITLKSNAWNLIGHFMFYKQPANTSGAFKCLENLLSSNELLYYYDNPSGRYVQAYNDYMVPGKGYWLWISNSIPDGSKYTPAIS